MKQILIALSLVGLCAASVARAVEGSNSSVGERSTWSFSVAAGYDTYIHTFPLATEDTTETISEMSLLLGLEGRSTRRQEHRWYLRPELSVGSELLRGRLEFDYQYCPDSGPTRFRFSGSSLLRRYAGDSDYALTSDSLERRASARYFVSPAGSLAGEVQLTGHSLRFRDPSILELDFDEAREGFFLRSGPDAETHFRLGSRLARRAYPDSAAIDRTAVAWEGAYESAGWQYDALRLFHRSERRAVRDETARPSAWSHWSDLEWRLSVGELGLATELQSEVWSYDEERTAFVNSWRLGGAISFTDGGSFSAPGWQVGLTAERLDAGSSPEAYTQMGARVGLETYGDLLNGSIQLEYGHRAYSDASTSTIDQDTGTIDDEPLTFYSDFNYWELWIMAALSVSDSFSCEIMANYQPEQHTERTDDSTVAFGSVRLVWRP